MGTGLFWVLNVLISLARGQPTILSECPDGMCPFRRSAQMTNAIVASVPEIHPLISRANDDSSQLRTRRSILSLSTRSREPVSSYECSGGACGRETEQSLGPIYETLGFANTDSKSLGAQHVLTGDCPNGICGWRPVQHIRQVPDYRNFYQYQPAVWNPVPPARVTHPVRERSSSSNAQLFSRVVERICNGGRIKERHWKAFGGPTMVQTALKLRSDDRHLASAVKGAIVLSSAIAKNMTLSRAKSFISRINIQRLFTRHAKYITWLVKREFEETWSQRPVYASTNQERKRLAYTYAPFWLLNTVGPSVLKDVEIKRIVLIQRIYRYQIRYGKNSVDVEISKENPLESTERVLMGLSARQARNIMVQYSGRDWVKDFTEAVIKKGLFHIDMTTNVANISYAAASDPKNKNLFRTIGRLIGISLSSGERIGSLEFTPSMYSLLLGNRNALSKAEEDYIQGDALRAAMEEIAAGFKDIIPFRIQGVNVSELKQMLKKESGVTSESVHVDAAIIHSRDVERASDPSPSFIETQSHTR